MRLKQVTIRNYRLHHEITVDFDPKLQLIGGRNESGKSTIAKPSTVACFSRPRV